jgi:hypothetical protein
VSDADFDECLRKCCLNSAQPEEWSRLAVQSAQAALVPGNQRGPEQPKVGANRRNERELGLNRMPGAREELPVRGAQGVELGSPAAARRRHSKESERWSEHTSLWPGSR